MGFGNAESAIILIPVAHGLLSQTVGRESTELLLKLKIEDSKIRMPYTLVITTSLKTSETVRRVAKIFAHSIKRAYNLNRGKKTLDEVLQFVEKHGARKLLILNQRKNGEVIQIRFYLIKKGVAYEEKYNLLIWNVIDHQIYGWNELPSRPPLSTGIEFARLFPDLTEVFESYFDLTVGEFREIWLQGDRTERNTIIQFVDPVKKLPFFSCNLSLRNR